MLAVALAVLVFNATSAVLLGSEVGFWISVDRLRGLTRRTADRGAARDQGLAVVAVRLYCLAQRLLGIVGRLPLAFELVLLVGAFALEAHVDGWLLLIQRDFSRVAVRGPTLFLAIDAVAQLRRSLRGHDGLRVVDAGQAALGIAERLLLRQSIYGLRKIPVVVRELLVLGMLLLRLYGVQMRCWQLIMHRDRAHAVDSRRSFGMVDRLRELS